MAYSFYHPQHGYWETVTQPTTQQINAYPKGTIEVPQRPSPYHFYEDSDWVEDTAARTEAGWQLVREQRDDLLTLTDWAVLPDSPHNTQDVLDYRQALRDLPQAYDKPEDVVWPENPLEG